MRATARLGIALFALTACASPSYVLRGDLLWHPRQAVGVPDLSALGWQRVQLDAADLAFRRDGRGVIAVRARCPGADYPEEWESRALWLGIPRGGEEHTTVEVDGRPALATRAESDGLRLHTLLVRTADCSIDIAYAAPRDGEDLASFERFVAGVRVGDHQ